MELDRSDDVKQSARSSIAIMNTDARSAVRVLALHTHDSESEDDESENNNDSKKNAKGEKESKHLLDLCPSWMGQVF